MKFGLKNGIFVIFGASILLLVAAFIAHNSGNRPRQLIISYDPDKPLPDDLIRQLEKYRAEGATVTFPDEKNSDFSAGLSHVDTSDVRIPNRH